MNILRNRGVEDILIAVVERPQGLSRCLNAHSLRPQSNCICPLVAIPDLRLEKIANVAKDLKRLSSPDDRGGESLADVEPNGAKSTRQSLPSWPNGVAEASVLASPSVRKIILHDKCD